MDHGQALRALLRRAINMIAFGQTTGPVKTASNVASVQVQLTSIENTTLTVVEQAGFASGLPAGSPVVAVFHGGDRSNGVVLGSTAPLSRPKTDGPEDRVMYGYGFAIAVLETGITVTAGGVSVSLSPSTGAITLTAPTVTVNGNLNVTGEVTRGVGTAGPVNLGGHSHPANNAPPTPGT